MPRGFADEQLAAFVAQPSPAFAGLDVAAMRRGVVERARHRPSGPEMDAVADLWLGELGMRLYRPVSGPAPLIVYLHGGGWTIGDLASHDRLCRRLADGSGAAVLAVDYRLAPEHPWPASVSDAVATLRWVASGPADLGEAPVAARPPPRRIRGVRRASPGRRSRRPAASRAGADSQLHEPGRDLASVRHGRRPSRGRCASAPQPRSNPPDAQGGA